MLESESPEDFLRRKETSRRNSNSSDETDQYNDIDEVCLVGQDLEEICFRHFGLFALKRIDLSFNRLRTIHSIHLCSQTLEELILDNNMLETFILSGKLEKLNTLSLSKNQIRNLGPILENLGENAKNLRYLSFVGNPICPISSSLLDDEENISKTARLYEKYRSHVIHLMKGRTDLRFLDHKIISLKEFNNARPSYKLFGHVNNHSDFDFNFFKSKLNSLLNASILQPLAMSSNDQIPNLDNNNPTISRSKYGKRRYRYIGKNSEGNRFIKDHDL